MAAECGGGSEEGRVVAGVAFVSVVESAVAGQPRQVAGDDSRRPDHDRVTSPKAQLVPWNVTEVHTFVGHVKSDRLSAPLLLSLTGLRPAEVVGLRWSDIDLTTDALTVANTRTMMGNKEVVEKDTKSMVVGTRTPTASPGKRSLEEVQGSPGG